MNMRMKFRNVVNDGTAMPPRLRMQYNMWALEKLPRDGEEWTVPQKLDQVVAAGFGGFEAFSTDPAEAEELRQMLKDRGLGIGFNAFAWTAEDLKPAIEMAQRMGAGYISAQVFGSLRGAAEITDRLMEMYEVANASLMPLFIETHRGRVTQDLRRTVKIVRNFGRVRFTGDFSHYIVAGEEGGPWSQELWDHFRPIAERCGNFHGRIGFGEQVQNDIGDGSGQMAQQFKKLWTLGMAAWLKRSQPGDILPFCAELGPPLYSITDLNGREISDRWAQSLVIKRLAEEAWADAQNELAN